MPDKKLNEKLIIKHIQSFFDEKGEELKELQRKSLAKDQKDAQISLIVNMYMANVEQTNTKLSEEDMQMLRTALEIQARAYSAALLKHTPTNKVKVKYVTNYSVDYVFIPTYPYYGGYGWRGCGCSCNADGDLQALFIIGVIIAIISALAAAFGMAVDTYESLQELFNAEKVMANLATLTFIAACVAVTCVAALAILASNPITVSAVAIPVIVIAAALLVKAMRAFTHFIDASLSDKSASATDSAFYLSKSEIKTLTDLYGKDNIEKIKAIVRGLGMKADKTSRVGFFGNTTEYNELLSVLRKVKKGEIPDDLCEIYGIPQRPQQSQGAELKV